ncbi:MAG: 16S rRNA (guanine(527)-N(7))-methyltransferase RsmG [Proteobacteria bacterium]|nr:16S rRNA (guanine(527)-N(7))-methyltransferase RsmG [Pseudomonadota bacterium]MBU1686965.1 16S rRNA (guanine(527)-N(7))-methyltransferase RsmG [Pseudomonadota bacterium]
MNNNETLLREGAGRLGVVLTDQAVDRLLRYAAELIKWNRRINLIGKGSEDTLIETHFLDSLTILPYCNYPAPGLMDVGSGAGFPGLAVKCAHPDLPVILVEPREKRATFLRHMVRTLHLEGIRIVEARLDENHPDLAPLRQNIPCITGRAVSSISDFLTLTAPFSTATGVVICMKGARAEEDLAAWQKGAQPGSYQLTDIRAIPLPFSGHLRQLVIFTHNK